MTKAFFDLRKNYGFKWNLNLSHVLTVLLNYGADEAAVFNKRFYQKHLEKHIEVSQWNCVFIFPVFQIMTN